MGPESFSFKQKPPMLEWCESGQLHYKSKGGVQMDKNSLSPFHCRGEREKNQ